MIQNKYSVAVFDMDGTILNTLEDLSDSINYALKQNGLAEHSIEEVKKFVGNGLKKLVERAVPDSTPYQIQEKVFNTFNDYYKDHCSVKTKPYPGIPEILKNLKNRGIKIAVNSNKPDYGVKFLCDKHFNNLFDIALGIKDGLKVKPAPDTLNEILKQLNCPKEKAVYIGDSDVDIQTAQNAGVDCISVSWGFKNKEFLINQGAKNIAENAEQLLNLLIN